MVNGAVISILNILETMGIYYCQQAEFSEKKEWTTKRPRAEKSFCF